MPATATTHDPEAIEAEISDLEDRRDRLTDRLATIESDLQDARTRLQNADSDEEGDEALDRAERLQIQHDTVEEAIRDLDVDLEALRERLEEAREAQRREEKLEELASKGRTAIQAREEYDDLRDEILDFLREKAPELARRFAEWRSKAEVFRNELMEEVPGVYDRRHTDAEDREEAEELVAELKDRGVTDMRRAIAVSFVRGTAGLWAGVERPEPNGRPTAPGPLQGAVKSVRKFGNRSEKSSE